jgi:hypothetical protein
VWSNLMLLGLLAGALDAPAHEDGAGT